MALDYRQAAQEILDAIGGAGNVVSAAHCATRLRLVIADDSKVDQAKVDAATGAKGNFKAAGQLQVIYGTGTVNQVAGRCLRPHHPGHRGLGPSAGHHERPLVHGYERLHRARHR